MRGSLSLQPPRPEQGALPDLEFTDSSPIWGAPLQRRGGEAPDVRHDRAGVKPASARADLTVTIVPNSLPVGAFQEQILQKFCKNTVDALMLTQQQSLILSH
jgi:hypothetical protein